MKNMNNVSCCIGCNIVDPTEGRIPYYDRALYLKNIEVYRHYGVSHLEFSHVATLNREDCAVIREACCCAGLIPWSVHSEHLNEGDTVEHYLEVETHCAEMADALDARVMICHLPNLQPRFDFERALDVLTRLADVTHKYNVKLAIENCLAGDIDFIIKVVDAINRPDVGINLDTGHSYYTGTHDIAEVVRKFGKRLFTTHIQDNFGENDDHQPAGLGCIDWPSTLKALKEVGYQGPLMMELTGLGVKARRTVPQLKEFPLEKEIVMAVAYLNFVWNNL